MTIAQVIFAAACAVIVLRAIMLAPPPPPPQPMPAFTQAGPVYSHDDGARD
jgi:hypothetical protein